MKIYKRGNSVFLNTDTGGESILKTLRHVKFNRAHSLWQTDATIPVFVDLFTRCKQAFVLDDTETAQWVNRCRILAKRLTELQSGVQNNNSREVVLPDTIDYVWEPFYHQKEAIAFALNVPKAALWLDMGLGKTYTSITIAKLRQTEKLGGISKVLVISPRSLMYQWKTEITTLAPNALPVIIHGTASHRDILLDTLMLAPNYLKFGIVTYEGLGSLKSDLLSIGFDMFILDEVTKIKNPKAIRTLNTVDICDQIKYGVTLTGMSYVSSPLDLFSQFLVLDKTVYGTNQWSFSSRYIDYGKASFGKFIKGYKHMDELKKRAYFTAFSRTKKQCLDLPERVYEIRTLPLYEAQFEWYDNLLGQMTLNPSEVNSERLRGILKLPQGEDISLPEVTVNYVVAMLEKFQQITSGFIIADTGEYIWLDSPKYAEMYQVIRESNDRFIVWARHNFVLEKISQYLATKGIDAVILDRRSSDAKRQATKRKFKEGKIKVLILQIQSECRGNDFTCSVSPVSSIFFENTASVEERTQAEDRQHRIGMVGTAVYIDLVCEDTYDEGIRMLLKDKRLLSEYIREQKLNILLGKGGSVQVKHSRSKKRPKSPSEVQAELDKRNDLHNKDLPEMEGMETFDTTYY